MDKLERKHREILRRPQELIYRSCYAPADLHEMLATADGRSRIRRLPPAQLYFSSGREYPRQAPEVQYPGHFEVRQVRQSGEIKWRGEYRYISQALVGEPVGLEPVSDRYWRVYFGPVPLALLDERSGDLLAYRRATGRQHRLLEDLT